MQNSKRGLYFSIFITALVFWAFDFILHLTGVGETNFYYLSKLVNAILFAVIWFFVFNSKVRWKKIIYSFIFGTWISLYYLISAYSGLVQFFGIDARETPPPFVIFGVSLNPVFWWIFHSLVFYLGLEISKLLVKNTNRK